MPKPTSLLIAYDAECSPCCRLVNWIGVRDRWGLVVFFPLQNPELVRMAPELAGRPLHGEVHGMDLGRREIWSGPALLPRILSRLPWWRWVAPALRLPGLRHAAAWVWTRRVDQRRAVHGRQPFQDRF
jgi:predicted DCC family thiol-disulfide oxidoreductase YuxK